MMYRLEWEQRTLGRSNSVFVYRCAKKLKFMLCVPKMQIALTPSIQRKVKFNVGSCGTDESELDFAPKHFNIVPRVWDCTMFNFSLMLLFSLVRSVLFWLTSPLPLHFSCIRCYIHFWLHPNYIVLHPVSSRASRTSGLRVQFIHHSWFIGYRNVWLRF